MSTMNNHIKRSHRSQKGHTMAGARRYVRNVQQQNVDNPFWKQLAAQIRSAMKNNKESKSDIV